jgi:hypothetical protein
MAMVGLTDTLSTYVCFDGILSETGDWPALLGLRLYLAWKF